MKSDCTNSTVPNIENKMPKTLIVELDNMFKNNNDNYTLDEIAYALHRQIELCRYEAEIDAICF